MLILMSRPACRLSSSSPSSTQRAAAAKVEAARTQQRLLTVAFRPVLGQLQARGGS
jgi:hypothetical protein